MAAAAPFVHDRPMRLRPPSLAPRFFFLLLCLLPPLAALQAAGRPANVLLIISDDLRDSVGCYGREQFKTPNIDSLLARGATRFDRAYAQYPVCNPSRSSFLTGLRPRQTGVVSNTDRLRDKAPDIVTWPQLLRRAGWRTAAFGKVFHTVGRTDAERALWQDKEASWDEVAYGNAEVRPGAKVAGRNLTNGTLKWCEWAALDCDDDAMPDGQMAARAVAAIEKAGAAPWFVAVGFHRPHDPFIVPKKYFDLYPEGSLTLVRDPADQTPAPPLAIPKGTLEIFSRFTDRERLEFLRAYAAGVGFMDAQVGRVLATLDRLRLWEDTLVIFMGDNGYHHGERGWWNKDTLFDRSCRVPLLVRPPAPLSPQAPAAQVAARGTPHADRVCATPVELVDLFPTVLDFLGLEGPRGLAGVSLRAQLQDPDAPGKGTAYTLVVRGKHAGRSVRTPEWRYTEWSDGAVELYDERADPEETHNLAADPARAALLAGLKTLLAKGG